MTKRQQFDHLRKLATLVRYYSLAMTTRAGSGHPSSSLSAADLMAGLMFGGTFRYDTDQPEHPNNDRLVFSKGHASPLFYALWFAAGKITEAELMTYRQFGSPLEGHPTVAFRYTEAATGSLGQGLSIGVGLALNAKRLDRLPYRTYILLGDSEMAEGSQWEALQIAAHYQLGNLIGVLDVNRLGQRGETMYGYDLAAYQRRIAAFGWETICIDGHALPAILDAFQRAARDGDRPTMIIARTIKGKGVSRIENQNGWHGKTLDEEQFAEAVRELGWFDKSVRGEIPKPEDRHPPLTEPADIEAFDYPKDKPVATRVAYGNALARLSPKYPQLVSLDGEVSNSTMAERLREKCPERFFEMYIAEQNMAGVALGLARRGKIPFVSTFAAFWSRAFDQVRMSQYSAANIKCVGSHAGVSIGEDGPSQMGLEDLAMFRTLPGSVVLHPADAVSTEKLVEALARHRGIAYLRTMRQKTPILYGADEAFAIGGSKVLCRSDRDVAAIVGAGATVHEALAACETLKQEGIAVRVIDLYSIKPLDEDTLRAAARDTAAIVTVEDHYPAGGLGEAVLSALAGAGVPVHVLAVRRTPKSGHGAELREYEGISAAAIVKCVKDVVKTRDTGRNRGNPLKRLSDCGQSIWLDYIQRSFITSGRLQRLIEEDNLRGVTSNPDIFEKAIAESRDYADSIATLCGVTAEPSAIYEKLAVEDVQMAADQLRPVYDRLEGRDGFVSLELSPHLAHDAEASVRQARRLWQALDRPNVLIKIPATVEGLPAIQRCIAEGININVTLLFGLPRYRRVAEAYLAGLEARGTRGESLAHVASVASFFLSRIDARVDPLLEKIIQQGGPQAGLVRRLSGEVALAGAKVAYQTYRELFGSARFQKLAEKGARPQRLLWASTGARNPAYSDVKYVEALIGPDTVNTLPLKTLDAYRDHGEPARRLEAGVDHAREVLSGLSQLGLDLDRITQQLEEEDVRKFIEPFDRLMESLSAACAQARRRKAA